MAYEFKLPDVGEGIHEAVIVKWLVAEGDPVKEDQPFVEIETDKAVVELPSPVTGKAGKPRFKPGDLVHVGDVLITFDDPSGKTVSPEPAPDPAPKTGVPVTTAPPVKSGTGGGDSSVPGKTRAAPQSRPLATPHTRALARRLGVELASVTPTGKGGRITNRDVELAVSRSAPAGSRDSEPAPDGIPAVIPAAKAPAGRMPGEDSPPEPVLSGKMENTEWGPVEHVKISRLRQVIARNMTASKKTLAHVTHVDEADVTDLVTLYKKVKQQAESVHNIKFTIMPFFVKAAVAAIKKYPVLNAGYDEDTLRLTIKHYYHIGFAADTPEGLMVPVIHNADRKDMLHIAAEIADKAARARERKLALEEMQGAGFTITNVGRLGGIFATPVIPLPQLALLGMHAMKDRPVVRDDRIIIRKMMNLSITFDHRMIDGMIAANFLGEIISLIENPELLMLRLV
jgi:pyruvate dehydrogenase E2 component (dihydrolipoamide acetyltransferase)